MFAATPMKTRTRGLGRIAAIAVLAVAGSAAVPAWCQGMPGGPGMGGPHMGGPAMGGHGMMPMGSPEQIARRIDRMLDGLNATDAQRTQIKQIAVAAATDLKMQHDAGRALRDKGMQIFAAPTIDATAAEALRQQMLASHDQASKRILQAMLDISKVLTPEQRAKIGERIKLRGDITRERMQRMQQGPGQKG